MSLPARRIEIDFEEEGDGSTDQGAVIKLEVSFWGNNPSIEFAVPSEGLSGTVTGTIKYLDLELVQTNPFCINIGGRRYCW